MFASITKHLKRGMSAVKSVLAVAGTAAAALDPTLRSYLREGESLDGVELLMLTRWRCGVWRRRRWASSPTPA